MTTSRLLAAALAIGALAAPAAQARPADNAPVARTAAASARVHDLRHLRAGAINTVGTSTPAVQPATRRRLPGPPTWPVNPQPIAPAHAVKAPDSSDVNPTTIGLGIAGALLALAGIVAFTRRSHHGRTRVTA